MKVKIPKKESDETPQHEKEEHKPIPKEKGPVEYPKDHQPGIIVPKNGSCCAKCKWWDGDDCENKYYRIWNKGSGEIPVSPEEYCTDWFEPAKK